MDLAIRDWELEARGEELQYFFDADVVLGTVNGLTSAYPGYVPDFSDLKYVVRALLSTGYLPPIRLLSPHLVEFDHVLRHLAPSTQKSYENLAELLQMWGLDESHAVLRRRIETPDGLFEYLQERGYGVFVTLELCLGGTWKQRVARLMRAKLLWLHREDLPEPNDPSVAEFEKILSEVRPGPNLQRNNYYDAVALAELARKVGRGIYSRFYTETNAVRHVFSALAISGDGQPVHRTEEYFLLRSSFPAVGFPNVTRRTDDASPFSLNALKALNHHLGLVLNDVGLFPRFSSFDADLNEGLQAEAIGGMGLGELIERFYNLGFLNSVFLSWTPRQMEQWLPDLSRVTSKATVIADVRDKLDSSFAQLWKTLDEEVGQLREWHEDHRRILEASDEREWALLGQRLRLDVELGFGQWGIPQLLQSQTVGRLEAGIAALMDRDKRVAYASDFALLLHDPTPETEELALRVCLLWFLRLNELVIRTFNRVGTTESERSAIPSWLRVFKILALARMAFLPEELSEIVLQAEADAAAADEKTRGYALGALARVCFRAWHLAGLNDKGAAIDWAYRSFEAARQAVSSLELGSLEWAFAVNECAYIGIETRVYPEETAQYVAMLIEQVPRAFYHHRFVDTIVWASTTQVILQIETHGLAALNNVPDLADLRRQLCMTLISGRTQLRENRTGMDEELIQHLTQIEHYLTMLRCEFVTEPGTDLR